MPLTFDGLLRSRTDDLLDRYGLDGVRDRVAPLQADAEMYVHEAGMTPDTFTSYAVIGTNIDRAHDALHAIVDAEDDEWQRLARQPVAAYVDNVRMLVKMAVMAKRGMEGAPHIAHPLLVKRTEALERELFRIYDERRPIGPGTRMAVKRGLEERKRLWMECQKEPFFHLYLQYLRDAQKLGESLTEQWAVIPGGIVDGETPFLYRRARHGATVYAAHRNTLQKIDMEIGLWQPATEQDEAVLGLNADTRRAVFDTLQEGVSQADTLRNGANWYLEQYLRGGPDERQLWKYHNPEFYEMCFEMPLP